PPPRRVRCRCATRPILPAGPVLRTLMSQSPPPTTRSGRRHGRPSTAGDRARLLRLALLPAAAVALIAAGAGAALMASEAPRRAALGVAIVAAGACLAVLFWAYRSATAASAALGRESAVSDQAARDRAHALAARLSEGQAEIQRLVKQIRRGERPEPR